MKLIVRQFRTAPLDTSVKLREVRDAAALGLHGVQRGHPAEKWQPYIGEPADGEWNSAHV